MAGELSQRIHSNFSTDVATWSGFRDEITGAYINDQGTGAAYVDYSDHLIREYNDKINDLNFSKELLIEPMDAGFRYVNDPLVGAFHSGLHSCFSARTIGFGGPLVRVRRASDNVEVDVRGNKNGELSLGSPVIDETENLLPYSEDISQWDETDGLFTKNITGGDSPLNPSTGHQFASTNIDRIVDGKLTGKLSDNWASSDASKVNVNAYVSGAQLIQNTNFERNTNNWTPQDGNISIVVDNLVSPSTYTEADYTETNVTFSGATDDPDFGQNAASIRETTTNGEHSIGSPTFDLPTGTKITTSSFVRSVGDRIIELTVFNDSFSSNKSARFELTGNGTVAFSNGDAATIERVVDDYYKVNLQMTTPTTSASAADDSSVRFRLRRDDTNLVTYSEDFSQWNNINVTLTSSQLDPFGGTDATIFAPRGIGVEGGTDRREILTSVTAGTTYFASVFVATGTSDNFSIQFIDHQASFAPRAILKTDIGGDGSFSTNTATSISNVTYTPSDNGFTRVSFSFTPSAESSQLSFRLFPDRDNGNGTTTFFGAQLSDGVGASNSASQLPDYVKTNGSTITSTTWAGDTSKGLDQFELRVFEGTETRAKVLPTSTSSYVFQPFATESGRQYRISASGSTGANATTVQLQALDNDNSNTFITASTAVTNGEMSKDFTAVSDTSAIALVVNDSAVPSTGFFTNCSAKEIVYKAAWNTTDTQTLTQSDKLGTIGGKKYNIKFSISDYESGAIKLSQPTPSEETLFSADGTYEVEVINDAQFGGFNDVQFKNQGTTNLKITDISAIESLPLAPYYQVYSVSGDDVKILAESTETLSVKSGDIFTASVYAKNVDTADGNLLLQLNRAAGGAFEETFQSLDAASTDSWQRFTAIHEFTGTHTKLRVRLFAPADATTSGQIFGFQLNRGSGAESYIRTEGSPITREKDPAPLKDFLYGSELVTDTKLRDSSQWSSQSTAGAVSFGDQGATFTITDGNYAKLKQSITYEVGKTYIATINAVGVSGTKHRVQDDDGNAGGLSNTVFFDFDGTNQTLTFPFVATADSDSIMLTRGTDDGRTYKTLVKSISVREYEDAFCTLWYDQSNFGTKPERNFQQPTAAYQPAITFSGTIPTGANGKPGVRWDFGKNMYMSSQISGDPGSLIDAFFVSDLDVTDVAGIFRQKHIYFTSSGNENYIIMESGSSDTNIGALGNANKTLRVNGVDYNPADPDLTRDDVFELLDHNKLYSIVGGVSSNYTGTHDNILNLGFYQSNPATSFNFEGLMQETIIYTGSQLTTRTGIEKNMNDHYGMF